MRKVAGCICLIAILGVFGTWHTAKAVTGEYAEAAAEFEQDLPVDQRITIQVMLAALGHTNHVPNVRFDASIFKAIKSFQASNGFNPSGVLSAAQLERLTELGASQTGYYGFRRVELPGRSTTIWVPLGLNLEATQRRSDTSQALVLKNKSLNVYLFSFAKTSAADLYRQILAKEANVDHSKVHYKTFNESADWFVISSTTQAGKDRYYRYHEDASGLTGFSLEWDNSIENVHAERIAVIMSASLGAAELQTPFIDPPADPSVADPIAEQARRAREAQERVDSEAREKREEIDRQRRFSEAERDAALARAEADKAKALAEVERMKRLEAANGATRVLMDKAIDCARSQLRTLVKSSETADALTSAAMTICDSEVDHVITAGGKAYRLEHSMQETDLVDPVLRAKLEADMRKLVFALAVQAKAGAGAFAPN